MSFRDIASRIVPYFLLAHFPSLEHEQASSVLSSSLCVFFFNVWSSFSPSTPWLFTFPLIQVPLLCLSAFALSPVYFQSALIWPCVLAQFFPAVLKFYLVVGLRGAYSISYKHFWAKLNASWKQEGNWN